MRLTSPHANQRALTQVEWLKERVARVPLRLVFESSLELMEATQVGGWVGEVQPARPAWADPRPAFHVSRAW